MAKVVIAGRSDCPYFSRVELLGDRLVKNLPSFQLHKIVKTPDEWQVVKTPAKAFANCSVIVILDELLQEEEETYESWIKRNCELFSGYAKEINTAAKKNVRVLIASNGPVNFNAMMMIKNAPNIPRQNIVALSRGVEHRAKAVIAQRLNVNTAGIVDLIVWGNVNGKHFIDNSKSRVHGYDGAVWGPPSYSVPVVEMVHDNKWLEKEYLELVQQRPAALEAALGHPASGSAARAISSMLTHWWNGSPHGQMFSLAVCSDGWYDVPEGLVFSYPVTMSTKGYWTVMQDMPLTEETKEKLQETIKDLRREMEVIFPSSRPPSPAEADKATEQSTQESAEQPTQQAAEQPAPEPAETKPATPPRQAESAPEAKDLEPSEPPAPEASEPAAEQP